MCTWVIRKPHCFPLVRDVIALIGQRCTHAFKAIELPFTCITAMSVSESPSVCGRLYTVRDTNAVLSASVFNVSRPLILSLCHEDCLTYHSRPGFVCSLCHCKLNHWMTRLLSSCHSLHIWSQNLITLYLNLCSLFFFVSSSNPHRSSSGSCPHLLFIYFFFFGWLSGLVSCITGNVTVSSFFFWTLLLLLPPLILAPPIALHVSLFSFSSLISFPVFFVLFLPAHLSFHSFPHITPHLSYISPEKLPNMFVCFNSHLCPNSNRKYITHCLQCSLKAFLRFQTCSCHPVRDRPYREL